ncbi:helix-turn-helix domain-containing protein [Selenomonas felix]|uniref:helix-turn-helix domain-containing protein n=1 Tax=Selenomonas felix TaxID=1944634 RepID=UPI000C8588AB|nr:AraC family transcriptional regulator [Selenomonas felix]
MTILYYKAAKKLPPPPAFGEALRLIYIGYNDREETLMPSAFHRHEHNLELQLICQGRGHIRIGSRMYDVQRGDAITRSILRALLQILLFQLPHEPIAPVREKDCLFIALKDYIDRHFMEELSVETLSARVHMSTSGLAHQFKKRFGFAPIQYIIRRIGEAQTLLVTTDLSITEVSARIGYDNISYFNNQFKKFTGLSPQSYRKYKVGMNQYKQLGEIAGQERRR